MTKRQRALHDQIRRQAETVKRAVEGNLLALPVGYSTIVRVPRPFMPHEWFARLNDAIIVTKCEDGYRYREYSPRFHRKGQNEPRARLLPVAIEVGDEEKDRSA